MQRDLSPQTGRSEATAGPREFTAEVMRDPAEGAQRMWKVVVGKSELARFPVGERKNAIDFANGYNLGSRHGQWGGPR